MRKFLNEVLHDLLHLLLAQAKFGIFQRICQKGHKQQESLLKPDVRNLVKTKEEQFAQASRIFLLSLFHRENHIPEHHNRRMSDNRVIGKLLKLPGQLQVGFAHLEENFNIPTLAVKRDDFFFCQG